MKTREETKWALFLCKPGSCSKSCPYHDMKNCYTQAHGDILDYVHQLELERAALIETLKEIDVFGECRQCAHKKPDNDG